MNYLEKQVVVIGAGPGGYAAAFYAASHGKDVLLIDKNSSLGGVCLNEGCIPSKALIHATELIKEANHAESFGISFGKPKIDLDKLRNWKNSIISKLNGGIKMLADKKNVTVLNGRAIFEDEKTIRVETESGQQFVKFEDCIIAVGSKPALPAAFDLGNKRIMTSKEALDIEEIPETMLVVGGGYIGLELGSVYSALGSKITVIEAFSNMLAGADPDLVRPVSKLAKERFKEILTDTKVSKMATKGKKIAVSYENSNGKKEELFDRVLVSVGRVPNSDDLGLSNAGIEVDDKKFIKVNDKLETNIKNIYAIGDIAGGILLAHKASMEAKKAVESICGDNVSTNGVHIPAVVFTDPEVAWCGLTETEAKEKGQKVNVSKFSWSASGRALSLDRTDGLTKLILEPETDKVLGVGIVGPGASELIAEGCLAVEMEATAEDLSLVVHPHPTLSETLLESAEVFYGHSAHAFNPSKEGKANPVKV